MPRSKSLNYLPGNSEDMSFQRIKAISLMGDDCWEQWDLNWPPVMGVFYLVPIHSPTPPPHSTHTFHTRTCTCVHTFTHVPCTIDFSPFCVEQELNYLQTWTAVRWSHAQVESWKDLKKNNHLISEVQTRWVCRTAAEAAPGPWVSSLSSPWKRRWGYSLTQLGDFIDAEIQGPSSSRPSNVWRRIVSLGIRQVLF